MSNEGKEGDLKVNPKSGKPMMVNVGHSNDSVMLVLEPCPGCGNSVIAPLNVEASMKVRSMMEASEAKITGKIIIP